MIVYVTERLRRRKKNKRKTRLDLFDCKKCIYDGCPPGCKWTWFEPPKCYNCDLGDKGKTRKCVCGEKATRAEVKAGQCKFFKERN